VRRLGAVGVAWGWNRHLRRILPNPRAWRYSLLWCMITSASFRGRRYLTPVGWDWYSTWLWWWGSFFSLAMSCWSWWKGIVSFSGSSWSRNGGAWASRRIRRSRASCSLSRSRFWGRRRSLSLRRCGLRRSPRCL
jgi:hypothetical protein